MDDSDPGSIGQLFDFIGSLWWLGLIIAGLIILVKIIMYPAKVAQRRQSIFTNEIALMCTYARRGNWALWFYALNLAKTSPTIKDAYYEQQQARNLQAEQLAYYTRANAR